MSYVIHGAPGSGSAIVEAACAEIGVDYEVRDLDARNDEHRGEAYAALNPQRKMPTLELPGGEVLTESLAIVITLDERHRDAGLLPLPGSPARAEGLRWMCFLATEMYPLVEIMDYPERFAPEAAKDAVRERALGLWRDRWRVLEGGVSGSPYALEGGFSAVDLYVTLLSRWDLDPSWRRDELPKVEAIAEAVHARPRLEPVWARHLPRGLGAT